MKKSIFLILLSSLCLFGMSFETFKKQTLKEAKSLKSKSLDQKISLLKSEITLRTPNPTLEIETVRYKPQGEESRSGYAVLLSQPIRTQGMMMSLKLGTEASKTLALAAIAQNRAEFIRELENYYTEYVYLSMLEGLLQKEIALSQRVTAVAKERYQRGAEDKLGYLRAKTTTRRIKIELAQTKQALSKRYYTMMALAGIEKKVTLDKRFIYPIRMPKKKSFKKTPQQLLLAAKSKMADAKAQKADTLIERFDLYGGIEKEPDQSILRFGVSVPLPLIHRKAEEKALAKLQKMQLSLQSKQYLSSRRIEREALYDSLKRLLSAYRETTALIAQQQELVTLLQEGYKLSGGDLFELLAQRSRLIQSKKERLQLAKKINQHHINLRYLQGEYR